MRNFAASLVTIDPGHFHAALVLKRDNPEVAKEVRVFAPPGDDVEAHVTLVRGFNARKDAPTSWNEIVCRDADYLTRFREWAAGDTDPSAQEGDNRLSDPIRACDRAHVAKFVKCVREHDVATAQPIDSAVKSNLLTELGNVSMLTGEAVRVDPATGRLRDPGCAAAKFWNRTYEPGWEVRA